MTKGSTVLTVIFENENQPYGGAAGDGSFIARFRNKSAADQFASRNTYYGKPCTVSTETDVPRRLMQRWSFAG